MSEVKFPLERTSKFQVFTFPEAGRVVEENPVCLCWISIDGKHTYTVTVSDASGEIFRADTGLNYAVVTLPYAGEYTWNVYCEGAERGEMPFTLAEYAIEIPRVDAKTLFSRIPEVHPRHLFFSEDIPEIVRTHAAELTVLRRNIEKAYADGMPPLPMYHRDPNALPYREFLGVFREYVDRNLVACALGYALLSDERAGAFAKEILLTLCDRNPHGPFSVKWSWGDEIGLSMLRCLPAVYDMLYPLLDERERRYVACTIRTYATQAYEVLKKLDYCQNPGNSHAGRLPAYLGEAALILKDSGVAPDEELISWLEYSLEIFGGIFPYYGTPDGGWAEGAFYSTSYTKWFIPFLSAVERFGGTRFLNRPFYQRLTKFFMHFANPKQENHPFGDGYWCTPDDVAWPGFFAQSPMRFWADRFGPDEAKKLAAQSASPELYKLHLLDIFLPVGKPTSRALCEELSDTAVFPDAGFVSMHTDIRNTENDVAVLARASRFGSDTHRHADQGSFAIYYKGTALISPSGYFGREYGTAHHFGWMRQTVAHNAILVDGVGQEAASMNSRGRIVSSSDDGVTKCAVLDISAAYPMLKKWQRTITLRDRRVTVVDEIEADHDVKITYPLHTLSAPIPNGNNVIIERGGVKLVVSPDSSLTLREISDKFGVDLNEGVPEAFHAKQAPQWHIYYETGTAKKHTITVTYDAQ